MKAPLLIGLALLLAACAGAPISDDVEIDTQSVLSGVAVLGQPVEMASLPEDSLMALTAEIRAYLATLAPGGSPYERLSALIEAYEAGEFHVEYNAGSTLTASKTFHQQRGNCLAFTLMMVAMARELGADAYFNQVDVPPVWAHEDEQTFVIYRHINMVSRTPRGRRVVDFDLATYDPIYDQHRLTDLAAFAQYYNNRGVELMQQNRRREAFLHLRKALQLNPRGSDLWSNLGAFYSRFGHDYEAEQSYLQALLLEADNLLAISNLERLYRRSGRLVLADEYAELARYHREHNPYYLYYRARDAYEGGEYKQARAQLRRAIRQYEQDHRFHFLMGLTSYRLGDMRKSHESFLVAFTLATSPAVKNAYMRKLDYLKTEVEAR